MLSDKTILFDHPALIGIPTELIIHPIKTTSITAIIPTLNEANNLPHVLPQIPDWVDELIIVDGHSIDDTIEVAKALCPHVRIVYQKGRGKGDALRAGFQAATGDIIIALDADGSTNPSEIPAFVGSLLAGADYVKGSRFLQGGGTADMELHRRAGNWGLMMLVRILYGGNYSDLCYGYFGFWRDSLPALNPDCDGFEVETLINIRALKAGLRIAEVPSFEEERIHGVSNLNTFKDGWRVLKTIVSERIKPTQTSLNHQLEASA